MSIDATTETSRITQPLWRQLSFFYQILQFCIKNTCKTGLC